MKKPRATLSALIAMSLAALALGACSSSTSDPHKASTAATAASTSMQHDGSRDPAHKAEVSTPAAAPVKQSSGGMQVVGSQPDHQYLHDLQQQSAFSSAFAAMDGVDKLPEWVRKGGTATPVKTVQVDGQSRLLAQACKPHSCPSEQVVLLYDKAGQSMQGVFVHDSAPGMDHGISDQAELTWLGQPDDTVKAWLKQRLTSR